MIAEITSEQRIADRYQRAIDEVLEEKLLGWSQLSPLDPTRMILSGLAGSLGQIEERQMRLMTQSLSLLPNLLGLEAKAAQGPRHLLQIASVKGLAKEVNIEAPPFITLNMKESKTGLRFLGDLHLLPVTLINTAISYDNKTQLSLKLSCRSSGPLSHLRVFLAPENAHETLELVELSITGKDEQYSLRNLQLKDHTLGLTCAGPLEIRSVFDRAFTDSEFEIILIYQGNHQGRPVNAFLNAFVAELSEEREWERLGVLTGEAWEEIALPQDLLEVPSELQLELPSGSYLPLRRINDRALRHMMDSSEDLRCGFIYNTSRHSLLVPNAHDHVSVVMAGLPLFAREAHFMNAKSIPLEDISAQMTTAEGDLFTLCSVRKISDSYPRESAPQLAERFHDFLRSQHSPSNVPDLRSLRSEILRSAKSLRSVEFQIKENELTVFLDSAEASVYPVSNSTSVSNSESLHWKLNEVLSRRLPLGMTWTLSRFQVRPVEIILQSKDAIRLDLNKLLPCLQKLCEWGNISNSKLLEEVQKLYPNNQVHSLRIRDLTSHEYCDVLRSQIGTRYEVHCHVA